MFDWVTPDFDAYGFCMSGLLALYAVANVVFSTPQRVARMRARALAHPDGATWMYRRIVLVNAVAIIVALCMPPSEPGVDLGDLGLAGLTGYRPAIAVAVLAAVAPLLIWRNRRASARLDPADLGVAGRIAHLIPRTARDRRWAVVTAVSVGVGEEVLYRGLLLAAATDALGVAPGWAALLTMALFALGHRYQGVTGVVTTFLVAGAMTALYCASGNLLTPIALHIAIDLGALLGVRLPAPAPAPPSSPAPVSASSAVPVPARSTVPVPASSAAPVPAPEGPVVRLRAAAPEGTTPI